MKRGDIVTIYEKIIAEEQPEGEAELLRLQFSRSDVEYWKVRFLSDGYECCRFIKR